MSFERDLSTIDPGRLSRLWSAVVPPGSDGVGGRAPHEVAGPGAVACDLLPSDLAEILRHQLAALLDPPASFGPDGDAPITYGELLAVPAPPIAVLRRVKDWAKPMMSRDDGELPREVAGVLYFAAVAAARVRGAGPISDLPDERLRKGATWALRLPWFEDSGLVVLFHEAVAVMAAPAAAPEPLHAAVEETGE